ncbi:MAG: hypothetical protein OEM00_12260, partial [Burkholderiaceae bacterium]|nr:hypothetical protein [Burkholderiaceae bacterium]
DAFGEVKDRVLQGPKPHSTLPECELHISGLHVLSAKSTDQAWANLYGLFARRQSGCLETDAAEGAGVAVA